MLPVLEYLCSKEVIIGGRVVAEVRPRCTTHIHTTLVGCVYFAICILCIRTQRLMCAQSLISPLKKTVPDTSLTADAVAKLKT